jgi:hypothetical protein
MPTGIGPGEQLGAPALLRYQDVVLQGRDVLIADPLGAPVTIGRRAGKNFHDDDRFSIWSSDGCTGEQVTTTSG